MKRQFTFIKKMADMRFAKTHYEHQEGMTESLKRWHEITWWSKNLSQFNQLTSFMPIKRSKRFQQCTSAVFILWYTNGECFHSCNGENVFMRWKWIETFHLSPKENILTIARVKTFIICFMWHQNRIFLYDTAILFY